MKRAIGITSITATVKSVVRCIAMTLTLLTITASAQITPSGDTCVNIASPTTHCGATDAARTKLDLFP